MHAVPAAFGTCPAAQTRRIPGTSVAEGGRQAPSTRRVPGGHGRSAGPPGTSEITGLAAPAGGPIDAVVTQTVWFAFGQVPWGQAVQVLFAMSTTVSSTQLWHWLLSAYSFSPHGMHFGMTGVEDTARPGELLPPLGNPPGVVAARSLPPAPGGPIAEADGAPASFVPCL
jgi:hypothetical protein